jgi:alpha-tubulin suppressor-like RCC1 family protein
MTCFSRYGWVHLGIVAALAGCGDSDPAAPDGGARDGGGTDGAIGSDAGPDASVPLDGCATQIALGTSFACSLRSDGQVWCWGSNAQGELGDATAGAMRFTPGPVLMGATPLSGVVEIGAGGSHACARTGGGVVCWGDDASGQLARTAPGPDLAAVELGGAPLDDAVGLALGVSQTCVLRNGGTAMCAGLNNSGQLGDGTDADRVGLVGVLEEGGATLMGITDLEQSSFHGCGVGAAGVVCWGRADNGQLGDGTMPAAPRAGVEAMLGGLDADPVVDLFVGFQSTCVVRGAGTTWCWGELESFGLTEPLMTFLQTASPMQMTALPPADGIAGGIGGDHVCVISRTGELWCFGRNNAGQLGGGTMTSRAEPAAVELEGGGTLTGVSAAVVNQNNTCALTASGAVYCTGMNMNGVLARAPDAGSLRAVPIALPCD